MNDKAPVSSSCPRCHQSRVVTYTSLELSERLRTDAAIEVMCITCDETWALSKDERAAVARGLERKR